MPDSVNPSVPDSGPAGSAPIDDRGGNPTPPNSSTSPDPVDRYAERDGAIVLRASGRRGEPVDVELANFVARIVEHVTVDDGSEPVDVFKIEAVVRGNRTTFTVPAKRFASMTWVEEKLGPCAIVAPGYQKRDELRAAIMSLSDGHRKSTIFRHVGWKDLDGKPVFLTSEGAVGASGPVPAIEVEPPSQLRPLILAEATGPLHVREAIRASLELLKLAPARVIYPLYASIWRSILGDVDFSLALVGRSGEFKTATAALLQQHFGSGFDCAHLPGNWSSTANALEETLHLAKDMLVVVDDYAPQASPEATRTLQSVAGRIFRSVGNRQGRQRMRADTTVRADRPPRCLVVSTGEDIPPGESVRARVLVIEIEKGDVSKERLTSAQRAAAAGDYARAVGAFAQWIAPKLMTIKSAWTTRIETLSALFTNVPGHRRTLRMLCELSAGLDVFLDFALESEVVSRAEVDELRVAGRRAILDAAGSQAEYQQQVDPAKAFVDAVAAGLRSRVAHLGVVDGHRASSLSTFGWDGARPLGARIGWLAGDGVYLDEIAAIGVARRYDATSLSLSTQTLCKRLFEAGYLASTDRRGGRTRFRVRRVIDGARLDVLHLPLSAFTGDWGNGCDEGGAAEREAKPSLGVGQTVAVGSIGALSVEVVE